MPSFGGAYLSAPFAAVNTWYTETFFLEHLPADMKMTAFTDNALCIDDVVTYGYSIVGFDRVYLGSPCDIGGALCHQSYTFSTLDWTTPLSGPKTLTKYFLRLPKAP